MSAADHGRRDRGGADPVRGPVLRDQRGRGVASALRLPERGDCLAGGWLVRVRLRWRHHAPGRKWLTRPAAQRHLRGGRDECPGRLDVGR